MSLGSTRNVYCLKSLESSVVKGPLGDKVVFKRSPLSEQNEPKMSPFGSP